MSKINATKETLDYIKQSKPGDKTVYLNMEALNSLPNEFESTITELKFNITQDFDNIGNSKYMPRPEFMYRIAEARGIYGIGISHTEPLIEPINISDMNMSEIPQMINMIAGYKSVKQSAVLTEDGTERTSSLCSSEYNAYNRCQEAWAKEEMYTEGYTKKGQYPNKYDNKYKRKNHFQSELKFALAKAETKAHLKTIRELAGLMTGYNAEDLKSGSFYFAKIIRSSEILKLETAARLAGMSKSLDGVLDDQKLLYGSEYNEEMKTVEGDSGYIHDEEEYQEEGKPMQIKRILQSYIESKFEIPEIEKVTALINWLSADVSESGKMWESAVKRFKSVESVVPEEFRISHSIY